MRRQRSNTTRGTRWRGLLARTAPCTAAVLVLTTGPALAQQSSDGLILLDLDGTVSLQTVLASSSASLVDTNPTHDIHRIEAPSGTDPEVLVAQLNASYGPIAELDFHAGSGEALCQDTIGYFGVMGPMCNACANVLGDVTPPATTPAHGDYTDQTALERIQASEPASHATESVFVALVGRGVDFAHPVLSGPNVLPGWDFVDQAFQANEVPDGIDSDGDGSVDEGYGAGTHEAGLVLLLNPQAIVLPVRVLDSDGAGRAWDVAQSIYYAVDQGARVIHLGVVMEHDSAVVAGALTYAELAGASVFAPTGNTGGEYVAYPARQQSAIDPEGPIYSTGVVAVTAVDAFDVRPAFAARGPAVDLAAPGVSICGPVAGGGYAYWSGTTVASTVATAAASLVASVEGATLSSTAIPLAEGADPVAEGVGAGRVNVTRAIEGTTE